MKLQRSTIIPVLLLVYLAVMSSIGWKGYAAGETTAMTYFGTIALTVAVIVLLHFNLKKRERLRRERLDDMARQTGSASRQSDNQNKQTKS